MAEELRIIRGDTYDIEFEVLDENNELISLAGWNVVLNSDTINKNSVSNPSDFIIETCGYGKGMGVVYLSSEETNPHNERSWCNPLKSHYKLRLYRDDNPAIVKTISAGDFIFIDEV